MFDFFSIIVTKLQSVFVPLLNAIFSGFDLMTFGFQRPASRGMEGIIRFHDDLMFTNIFITMIAFFIFLKAIYLVIEHSNSIMNFFMRNWFPILNGGALFILTTALSDQTSS